MPALEKAGTAARYALGVIRIVNGAIGLAAPAVIMRRFGEESPASNPAATYALRLFGVRTLLIGVDLLRTQGRELEHALRAAPFIHASDTATVLALTAFLASRRSRR